MTDSPPSLSPTPQPSEIDATSSPKMVYELYAETPDGVIMRTRIWTDQGGAARLSHSYLYRLEEEAPDPIVVNSYKILSNYSVGALQDIQVRMHVVIPSRLGKQYLAGMDISPGAKTLVCFYYRPDEHTEKFDQPFKLWKIQVGARDYELPKPEDADDQKDALMPVIDFDFPFPVQTQISRLHDQCGFYNGFQVQYLHCDQTVKTIEIPPRIGSTY